MLVFFVRAVALSNKPGIFPVGKMPNRVFLTVFSLDYYELKWSKLRISSAKLDCSLNPEKSDGASVLS